MQAIYSNKRQISIFLGMCGAEGQEGEVTNGHEDIWGSNGYKIFLYCSDYFLGMYVCMYVYMYVCICVQIYFSCIF